MPNVTSFQETFGSREATDDVNGPKVTAGYVRRFKFVLDSGGLGADYACAIHGGLPLPREVHPFDPFARVKSRRISPESDDDKIWIAEVTYSTDVLPEEQHPENPLDKPDVKSWGFQQFQRPIIKDIDGDPIINTAKEQFDPPPERDDSRLVLTVSRNIANFPVALADAYTDAINSDAFLGFAAGTVKCASITGDQAFTSEGQSYYQCQFVFHFRREGWKLVVLNQGFRGLIDGVYYVLQDDNGLPLNAPALLDNDGLLLDPGGVPVFLEFDIYDELPFSAFNIS